MSDPCDLRALDPRTRELTLAALRGWACPWPYQPPRHGRSPGRAYELRDRYGHVLGTDRHYDESTPRDPTLWPREGRGRLL